MTLDATSEPTTDDYEQAEEADAQDTALDEEEAVADSHDPIEIALRKYRKQIARKQRLFNSLGRHTKLLGNLAFIGMALVTLLYFNPISVGTHLSLVTTGSMRPYVQPGDVALTVKYDSHKGAEVGDIILVQPEAGNQYLHRVVAVNPDGTYETQGDASEQPDRTPVSDEMIIGEYWNSIEQPVAGIYSFFMLDPQWFSQAWTAAQMKDWTTIGNLLQFAPWGWAVLLSLGISFRAIVPRIINIFIDRANRDAVVEAERLRLAVATQEEAIADQDETIGAYEQHFAELDQSVTEHEGVIGEHEEVIAEVTPVVREIVQEREEEKAEKEASAQAIAAAWDKADFTQIYDEPEEETDDSAFFDVYNKQFNTGTPSAFDLESEEVETSDDDFSVFSTPFTPGRSIEAPVSRTAGYFPRFAKADDEQPTNPFSRLARKADNAPSAVTSASLRDEDDQFAALGLRSGRESRSAASAFDLEEI